MYIRSLSNFICPPTHIQGSGSECHYYDYRPTVFVGVVTDYPPITDVTPIRSVNLPGLHSVLSRPTVL